MTEAATTETTTTEAAPAETTLPTTPSGPPEGLPENYWDAEKGSINVDALNTDLSQLKTIQQQYEDRLAQLPENPEGYELRLPEDFQVPEGLGEFRIPEDSVLAKGAREWALKNQVGPAELQQLVGIFAQDQIAQHEAFKTQQAEDIKSLGDRAQERINTVETFLKSKLDATEFEAIAPVVSSAAAVKAMEKLIAMSGRGPAAVPGGGTAPSSKPDTSSMTARQKLDYANELALARK